MQRILLPGRSLIGGSATGSLLASDSELSFWGGVNPKTGEVIDRFHPLCGQILKDKILAIPSGKGSCTGSAIALELILNDCGPRAFIFERVEEIITLGVIVADEMFQKTIPVIVLSSGDFSQISSCNGATIHVKDAKVSTHPSSLEENSNIVTSDSDRQGKDIRATSADQEMLDGKHGEATRLGLKIIMRMAEIMEASELIDISQAHVDGTWYGPGSLTFGETLRELGGRFRVPTTLNALNIDQRLWQSLGIDEGFGEECTRLTKAFLDMGAKPSFTCAPYQLETAPKMGDRVAWGESNAVVYANSVLGARTLKTSNMFECLIGITGRAPLAGPYLNSSRKAALWVRVPTFADIDDSFWPIVGYSIGSIAASRIPAITGMEHLKPSSDDLKAFSAAFATSSSAPMFHIVNITPEAPMLEAVYPEMLGRGSVDLTAGNLQTSWNLFNQQDKEIMVDLVSLGNPHFSLREIKSLAKLCRGRKKQQDVAVIVTCGRTQHALAIQAGYIAELESFGIQFLTDTCWCFIGEPVIPRAARTIMTNSGKYAHYGPGLTGRQYCFGSLRTCVDVACFSKYRGDLPGWLVKEI